MKREGTEGTAGGKSCGRRETINMRNSSRVREKMHEMKPEGEAKAIPWPVFIPRAMEATEWF